MDISFNTNSIDFDVLHRLAFNFRWAEVREGVIPLTAADSDFPVAPELKAGLQSYINDGYFCYAPKMGYPDVAESIARQLNNRKNEHVSPKLLLTVDSAARGMYIITKALLNPGDDALIFDPVDFLFRKSVEAAGANCVLFPAKVKNNRIDVSMLENYITKKTRMIGLCNPHNPYGTLYSYDDLRLILDLAEKYDLYIMNDEIWSDIVFAPSKFLSILNIDPSKNSRIVSVYGFSKSFSIAGLRAGCIYCHSNKLFDKIVDAADVMTTAGGISSLSQLAAKICMDQCYYWNEAFVEQMRKNRDYAYERISKMPLISCHKPDATFLLFPDITATGMDSRSFVDLLDHKYSLALVPGTPEFFGPGGAGHVRICLATSMEILTEGMNRLESCLCDLSRKPYSK